MIPQTKYYNCTDRPEVLDINAHYADIVSYTRQHRLYQPCLDNGWEVDDLLQFIAMGVHRRQSSPKSRYNPKKGTVGLYLNMVTRNLLSHAFDAVSTDAQRIIRSSVPFTRHDEDSEEDSILAVEGLGPDEAELIDDVVDEVERRQPGAAAAVRHVLHGGPAFWLTPKEAGALRTAINRRRKR